MSTYLSFHLHSPLSHTPLPLSLSLSLSSFTATSASHKLPTSTRSAVRNPAVSMMRACPQNQNQKFLFTFATLSLPSLSHMYLNTHPSHTHTLVHTHITHSYMDHCAMTQRTRTQHTQHTQKNSTRRKTHRWVQTSLLPAPPAAQTDPDPASRQRP